MSNENKNAGNQSKRTTPEVKAPQQNKEKQQKQAGKPSGKPSEKKA